MYMSLRYEDGGGGCGRERGGDGPWWLDLREEGLKGSNLF